MAVESYNPERSPELVEGRSRRERLMAETAVAGAQTPVQAPVGEIFPPQDTQGAVAEAERILGEARNQNSSITSDAYISPTGVEEAVTAQTAETTPPGPTPPGGVGGRGGDGNGEGFPGGPEGPRGPLPPDYLWNPEFRAERWSVVAEIVRLESLSYEEKYDGGENERNLGRLYREWKHLESLDNSKSHSRKSFNVADFEPPQITSQEQLFPQQDLTGLLAVRDLFASYDELLNIPSPSQEQLDQIATTREQLSRYFKEAKRRGLLESVDAALRSIAKEIQQGLDQGMSPDEIMTGVEERYYQGIEGRAGVIRRIEAIRGMAERTFRAARRTDSEIANLEGVWDIYIQLALDRLMLPFNPRLTPPLPIEGEFTFEAEGEEALRRLTDEGEIYWRPTYANYFTVYARTPEQFERAKETFIRWMRTGLGKSPEEVIQKVNGFKEALTSAGQRTGLQEYTVRERQELEAIMGIIVANFFNEQYKPDYFKQGWTFAAQFEGRARMLRLARTSRGVMAAVLHKFDKDPRFELLFSPHGSRGQLMSRKRNAIEMRDLGEQILAILTAEAMGIALKGYHPGDSEKMLDGKMYGGNLDEIVKFKSDEDFKNLYEGFDLVEQGRLLQELEANPMIQQIRYAMWVDSQYRQGVALVLTTEQSEIYNAWKSGRLTRSIEESEKNTKFARWVDKQITKGQSPKLTQEQTRIYDDWKSGRLTRPVALSDLQTWERLDRAKRIREYLEKGGKPEDIREDLGTAEAIMYAEANNAVTMAYELYGAMGEKAKRGGAVFLVDRKDKKDAEGRAFRDYIPNHWAEKFVHFAENWTKATYGHLPAGELKYKADQARRMAIWALKTYGFDAKLWDFTLLKDGKPVDPNTLGYHPSYGVNRNTANPIEKYRYAVPENPRILGYNNKGEGVILVFDNKGKPITGNSTGLEFDLRTGKAVIFDKPSGGNLITFDNLDRTTEATRPMLLKKPKEEDDPQNPGRKRVVKKADGNTAIDGENEKGVPVDFNTAIHHIYARWTGHPYWGYQEEDTGLFLDQEALDAAKAVREGTLRWQDAPPHAVQRLIVDPTLERTGHYDLENIEAMINLAAVEESYQAHWRIGDELYMNFFPADASRLKNRTAYVLQDHGGSTKEWFHARAEAALWPDVKARRLRTFIPFIPLRFASMSEMWGAPGGALDVFRMMGYDKYPMVGQFAMDKWINQTGAAQDVYDAIFDWYSEQEKKLKEGLGRKLNNEADTLRKFYKQFAAGEFGNQPGIITRAEDADEEFLKEFRGTLNRVEVVMNRNTVLQSVFRGERAPLLLEGVEIYKRRLDGTYIRDENDDKILNDDDDEIDWNRDSGSSRHDNNIFVYRYWKLARSSRPLEGQALYAAEAKYYELGDKYTIASMRLAEEAKKAGDPNWERFLETRIEWFNGKANN